MKQVADDTWRLGSSGHNYYLMREGDEATLVDAGCSREWGSLVKALAYADVAVESLRGVVATHSHADHFGLATTAQEHGIPVSVHVDEEARALGTYEGRYAAAAGDLPMFRWHVLKTFTPMMLAGVMKLEHVESVTTFVDGQVLDLPGGPVAVHTPGHTEGHTMFHVPDRGLLFTGDGLVTMNLLAAGTGPQLMNPLFDNDSSQAEASLDRIVDLPAKLILPGHGDPWPGSPADAVAVAREG